MNQTILALAGIVGNTEEGNRLLVHLVDDPEEAERFLLDWHVSGNLFWRWHDGKPIRIPPESLEIDGDGKFYQVEPGAVKP
jgi:hypothetical protein